MIHVKYIVLYREHIYGIIFQVYRNNTICTVYIIVVV